VFNKFSVQIYFNQRDNLKVQSLDIYMLPLTLNDHQRFTIEVAYWPAMTLGGAAQLVTAPAPIAQMNRLWTPQSAARQIHLCPSQPHYGFHPAMFSDNDSLFLVASVTRY